jgi:hypothetical protein
MRIKISDIKGSYDFQKANSAILAALTLERKPNPLATLVQNPKGQAGLEKPLPASPERFRVTIVALRSKPLDSDNHVAGCKGLRDIIADWIGTDDKDTD